MGTATDILPFLKWAGGKRWLVQNHSQIFPRSFLRYVEPFLGSGAVFFFLQPSRSLLADVHDDLINTYSAIRQNPGLVRRYLAAHHHKHSASYYYLVRDSYPRSVATRAARTIYLNRTCWNGLFRVNRQGIFNVPVGTKTNVLLPTDNFAAAARLLKNASLFASDFEPILDQVGHGDFVFVDPPYTVNHNLNGFLKYNENIFSWDDQLRLRNCIENAVCKGAKVLVTNADHKSVRRLYRDFDFQRVSRSSVIAASNEHRGKKSELLIQCW